MVCPVVIRLTGFAVSVQNFHLDDLGLTMLRSVTGLTMLMQTNRMLNEDL